MSTHHALLTFVCPCPGLIKALLASSLGLVPRRENRSHLLHFGWVIRLRQLAGGAAEAKDSACAMFGWRGRDDDADYATAFTGASQNRRMLHHSTLQLGGVKELMVAETRRSGELC